MNYSSFRIVLSYHCKLSVCTLHTLYALFKHCMHSSHTVCTVRSSFIEVVMLYDVKSNASFVTCQVLAKYPNGAMFLFYAGRLQEMRGNLDQAVRKFEASIDSQSQWQQV